MAHFKGLIISLMVIAVVFFTAVEVANYKKISSSGMQAKIGSRLGFLHLDWNTDFQTWTNTLGVPNEVDQIDSAHTFFYWPTKGVAIFCHPLFNRQFSGKPKERWLPTSIFIALDSNEFPKVSPINSPDHIKFSNLIFTQKELNALSLKSCEIIPHTQNGRLIAVEIHKPDSFFGDYN